MNPARWKAVIHLHTDYSSDSDIAIADLAGFAERAGIDCLAVTDHDTIEGAIRLRDTGRVRVVVGEEITTTQGHLIGLFLDERVPPGLPPRRTAEMIRQQGGVVLLPHPFNRFMSCGMAEAALGILDLIDAVEINNAQNLLPGPDRAARRFALAHGLATYVGADSHRTSSIAPCWQLLAPFDGPDAFRLALAAAELRPGRHPLPYFFDMGMQYVRYLAGMSPARSVGVHAQLAARTTSGKPLRPRQLEPTGA